MTNFVTFHDLLTIVDHYRLASVRDVGLLDSAAHRPQTSIFGDDAYPTLDEKVAVLLESIVRNHPLLDGNKRLGWLAAVVMYDLNGLNLDAPEGPAYDLVIGIAEGRIDYPTCAGLLASWTVPR